MYAHILVSRVYHGMTGCVTLGLQRLGLSFKAGIALLTLTGLFQEHGYSSLELSCLFYSKGEEKLICRRGGSLILRAVTCPLGSEGGGAYAHPTGGDPWQWWSKLSPVFLTASHVSSPYSHLSIHSIPWSDLIAGGDGAGLGASFLPSYAVTSMLWPVRTFGRNLSKSQ